MKIIQIISEHKKIKGKMVYRYDKGVLKEEYFPSVKPKRGYKRVEAIVSNFGILQTRHIDIKK